MNYCVLCKETNGEIIWKDNLCRLVSINEKNQFGTHRLIWNKHVKELRDLSTKDQNYMFGKLIEAEKFVSSQFSPHKVNVASIGNLVPHLHWHIIPRWKTDPWWPNTVWGGIKKPVWSSAFTDSPLGLKVSICVADWTNLKTYIQKIRKKVFIHKQKIPSFKEWDFISRHVIIKQAGEAVATGRLLPNGEIEGIAVLKKLRHQGYGRKILNTIVKEAQNKKFSEIIVHARISDCEFYEQEGFITYKGKVFEPYSNLKKMTKKLET